MNGPIVLMNGFISLMNGKKRDVEPFFEMQKLETG